MLTYPTHEAKARLSELLDLVRLSGVEVTITRHRVPVAKLVPVVDQEQQHQENKA